MAGTSSSSDTAPQENNCDEENSVTMLDVLQEENQLEEDANAVLGASDDKNCTYIKGYIRQALYACKTCCTTEKDVAGICLACSFHCHEGHELVELYTKRHFRCDCGNSKFQGKKCILDNAKSPVNEENMYNQNFKGVYCICSRPYPDPEPPEGNEDDEMMQCVICEDWYHSKHLNCESDNILDDNSYEEMICRNCMNKHEFFWDYTSQLSANKNIKKIFNTSVNKEEEDDKEISVDISVNTSQSQCTKPKKLSADILKQCRRSSCFWLEGWRSSLCRCDDCKNMYKTQQISFLLDSTDSVKAYEEAGKLLSQSSESQYEKGMKALASLGHIQQVNAIEEYNIMKERLKQYLQKFVENKKVVREEDIKEFFSGMESNKKSKVIVPTFCR